MQFSDSDSSSASSDSGTAQRVRGGAARGGIATQLRPPTGRPATATATTGGLDSTVRAFAASGSEVRTTGRVGEKDQQMNSSLRVSLTARGQHTSMSSSDRGRLLLQSSSSSSVEDEGAKGARAGGSARIASSSQAVPPFFLKRSPLPAPTTQSTPMSGSGRRAGSTTAEVRTFQLLRSSSDSSESVVAATQQDQAEASSTGTSSLSLSFPEAVKAAQATGARRNLPPPSPPPAQERQCRAVAGGSGGLHPLKGEGTGMTSRSSSAQPAHIVPAAAGHARSGSSALSDSSDEGVVIFHKLLVPTRSSHAVRETPARSVPPQGERSGAMDSPPTAEVVVVANASSTAADTSVTELPSKAESPATTPMPVSSACSASATAADARQAAVRARPPPALPTPPRTAADILSVLGSTEDVDELEEIDSNAASEAAQAALDAAESRPGTTGISSTVSANLHPSASATSSHAAIPLQPPSHSVAQQAETPGLHSQNEEMEKSTVESHSTGTVPATIDKNYSPVSPAAEEVLTPLRSPPEVSAAVESLSSDDIELTIEHQRTPMTQGTTFTLASTAEVAHAVVGQSASLLPPTRSNSTSGSSNSEGNDDAQIAAALAAARCGASQQKPQVMAMRPAKDDTSSSSIDGSSSDATGEEVFIRRPSPPPPHDTSEDDEGGTLRSLTVGGGDGTNVEGPDALQMADLKRQELIRGFSVYAETHGATQTAAQPTTVTTNLGSSSRTSGVLMPPTPSQPRPLLSPHDGSLESSATSFEREEHEEGGAALANRPVLGMPGGVSGAMHMAPKSTSSSSVASSLSVGKAVHHPPPTPFDAASADDATSSSSLSVDPRPHGQRKMPMLSSGSDTPLDAARLVALASEGKDEDGDTSIHTPSSRSSSRSASSGAAHSPDLSPHLGHAAGRLPNVVTVPYTEPSTPVGLAERQPTRLQEAGRWDEVLRSMELIDCTVVSRVYEEPFHRSEGDDDGNASRAESNEEDMCLIKVISLFPIVAADKRARWGRRAEVQRRLLALAQEMRERQRALDQAGLTATGAEQHSSVSQRQHSHSASDSEENHVRRTTCAGIVSVYVDSDCRLIGQLEVEPFMVPLRHLLPLRSDVGLREAELHALLRIAVSKAATMHNAGFVHGALHSGNVLLSSYDGDTVLTQPCGIMSQSACLPSDLSVISVGRACAMAPQLRRVWGTQRLHVSQSTSARLGAPSRPELKELLSYHNLAALGWETPLPEDEEGATDTTTNNDGDVHRHALDREKADTDYTPTTVDDVYALGMLAFLLYLGIPPFHTVSLWAAVDRLVMLAHNYAAARTTSSTVARRVVEAFVFGDEVNRSDGATPSLLSCAYSACHRHAVGRLHPAFESALRCFIVDCVEASCAAAVVSMLSDDDDEDSEAAGEVHKGGASGANISGGTVPVYKTAQDLLDHHVLLHTDPGADLAAMEEELRDTAHRLVYPAYCVGARTRKAAGSTPYLARLHSNALYEARCTSLYESLRLHTPTGRPTSLVDRSAAPWTLFSTLSPEVGGQLQTWRVFFPAVEHVNGERGNGNSMWAVRERVHAAPGEEEEAAGEGGGAMLVLPSAVAAPFSLVHRNDTELHTMASTDALEDAMVAQIFAPFSDMASSDKEAEFHFLQHLHCLFLAHKQDGSYALSRAFLLRRILHCADTLVLQHLRDCTVTLLAPFRYVVLDDVEDCEIRLGPCEVCVLRHVRRCPVLAVAAYHIRGVEVEDVELSWSGQGGLSLQLEKSHGVRQSLYGLAYPGLVEDCKRVGLSLEHLAVFPLTEEGSDAISGDEERQGALAMRRRTMELLATTAATSNANEVGLCLTPEAPYAHALLTAGSGYVHRGHVSCAVAEKGEVGPILSIVRPQDNFHYYGELNGKDVLVSDVHGSSREEIEFQSASDNGASPSSLPPASRPIVFLQSVLGDVHVTRCSFCTIAVVGTPNSLLVSDCHNCQLIVMSREASVQRCSNVDCVALVTECMLFSQCAGVRVRPLFLDCPYTDEILQQVVAGSVGGAEEDTIVDAYEGGRLDLLNAVLRGLGSGVEVEASTDVVIEDLAFFQPPQEEEAPPEEAWLSVFTVPFAAIHRPGATGDGANPVGSDASEVLTAAAAVLATQFGVNVYTELLQRYEDATDDSPDYRLTAHHETVLHDLLDCSVLRLRGAVCPVQLSEADYRIAEESGMPAMAAAATVDLCLERLHYGVVFVDDAVKTLQLRDCVGPLDVVVGAAARVVMEHCVGVQLRVACAHFSAVDCVRCHVALHVSHPPKYERCTGMQTSALNITANDYESLLNAAGVDLRVNRFNTPALVSALAGTIGDSLTPVYTNPVAVVPSLAPECIHAFCDGCVAAVTADGTQAPLDLSCLDEAPSKNASSSDVATQAPLLMALLRQPVTVVAPLPGLCVSPQSAPFVAELETPVLAWTRRHAPSRRTEVVAHVLFSLADVAQVYTEVLEWQPTPAVGEKEEEEKGVAAASPKKPASECVLQADKEDSAMTEDLPRKPSVAVVVQTAMSVRQSQSEKEATERKEVSLSQEAMVQEEMKEPEVRVKEEEEEVSPKLAIQASTEARSVTPQSVSAASLPTGVTELPPPWINDVSPPIGAAAAHSQRGREHHHYHDPVSGTQSPTMEAQPWPVTTSAALQPFEESSPFGVPLSSGSPTGTSLGQSVDLRTTTNTLAGPFLGTSSDSVVNMPPMAPAPAFALPAHDVGASATFDMFGFTQASSAFALTMTRKEETVLDSLVGSAAGSATTVPASVSEALPSQSSPIAVGAIAARLQAEAVGIQQQQRPPQQAGALTATTNLFLRDEDTESPSSPPLDLPPGSGGGDSDRSKSRSSEESPDAIHKRQHTAQMRHASLITPVQTVTTSRERGATGDSRDTTSSVSDYPHRGMHSYHDVTGADTVADGDHEERQWAVVNRKPTNYLHVSQELSGRPGEASSPLSRAATSASSPVCCSPAERGSPQRGAGASNGTSPSVDRSMGDLRRRVEEARRQHRQREQQGPSEDALAARVRAAVAKLSVMKAPLEATALC